MRGVGQPALSIAACVLGTTLLAILAGGCGSSGPKASSGERTEIAPPQGAATQSCAGDPAGAQGLRASGVGCATGRDVVAGWLAKSGCAAHAGASHSSCTVGAYRCLGTVAERGIAVSCARPGRSVSFVVERK